MLAGLDTERRAERRAAVNPRAFEVGWTPYVDGGLLVLADRGWASGGG
jgi:hypothetical protein